jgi:DNA modification methylase
MIEKDSRWCIHEYYEEGTVIICGDALTELRELPDESVRCCITSPPYYGLRDYGVAGQFGLERTPKEYVAKLVEVFREARRVLRKDGALWLVLGDSYWGSGQGYGDTKTTNKNHSGSRERIKPEYQDCGLKPKDLVGIPWRVAFALQADGWWLRQDIIWAKPNPMPESITDRCTKAHEYIFMLTKSAKYWYDAEAVSEPCATPIDSKARCGFGSPVGKCNSMEYSHSNKTGKRWEKSENRNLRSVWTITTRPFPEAHFATFPPEIPELCIKAGCPKGGTVLDPFFGAGTTGLVAMRLGRKFIGIELNPKYCEMARKRIYGELMEVRP